MNNENNFIRNVFMVVFVLSLTFFSLGLLLLFIASVAKDKNIFTIFVFTLVSGIIAYLSNYYVVNTR